MSDIELMADRWQEEQEELSFIQKVEQLAKEYVRETGCTIEVGRLHAERCIEIQATAF